MSEAKEPEFEIPKRSFTIEFWVGLFALVGMACFAYLAINIASIKLSNAGFYNVTATFTNVAGLKAGAPVEIAGVRIGQVSEVRLDDTEAVVTLQIQEGVSLREEDIAQIRTKGIIGDKYVRISPGFGEEDLADGGHIVETEPAVEFEEIIGKLIHGLQGGGSSEEGDKTSEDESQSGDAEGGADEAAAATEEATPPSEGN